MNKDVLIIFKSKSDWNGDISSTLQNFNIPFAREANFSVMNLVGRGFSPPTVKLGQNWNDKLTNDSIFNNTDKLSDIAKELDKDGIVILNSCNTGKVDDSGNFCLVQSVASKFSDQFIVASIRPISALGSHAYWNGNKLEITFIDAKKSNINGIKGRVKNCCYRILFTLTLGFYGDRVDARFRHSIKALNRRGFRALKGSYT